MPINRVLAGVAVADLGAAANWYEQLFGRGPDAEPMDGLAEWHVPSGGVVQVVADPEAAGGSLLTLDIADLEAEAAAMRERGLEIPEIGDSASDKFLLATVEDLDGNTVTLVEQK